MSLSREVASDFCYTQAEILEHQRRLQCMLDEMKERKRRRSTIEAAVEQDARRKKVLVGALAAEMAANLSNMNAGYYCVEGRERNLFRDRSHVVGKITSMKDNWFKRQYRLDKPTFDQLLATILPDLQLSDKGMKMAIVSSGSAIDPIIKLAITLRLLAGGSYLDIAFGYCVAENTVLPIAKTVISAINRRVKNIHFDPTDLAQMEYLESTFVKYSNGMFPGTVAAGDGVVFRMQKPLLDQVEGNVTSFYTRKGYYAYGLQGFVDGDCKFVSISMKTCASTDDGTSYLLTKLSQLIRDGMLPKRFHVVLDAAYTCTNQELCPWPQPRKGELSAEKDTFNYYLSLHRQCVERAFGQLLGRWGIFWRPLRFDLTYISTVIAVCCKLHNICIDAFGSGNGAVEVCPQDSVYGWGGEEEEEEDVDGDSGWAVNSSSTWATSFRRLRHRRRRLRRRRVLPQDVPDATVLWTDGVTISQGSRTDRAKCQTRIDLTNHLQANHCVRPAHSRLHQAIRRIKDATVGTAADTTAPTTTTTNQKKKTKQQQQQQSGG